MSSRSMSRNISRPLLLMCAGEPRAACALVIAQGDNSEKPPSDGRRYRCGFDRLRSRQMLRTMQRPVQSAAQSVAQSSAALLVRLLAGLAARLLAELPMTGVRNSTLTLCRKGRDTYRYDRDVVVGAELPSAGVTYYEVPAEYGVRNYPIHDSQRPHCTGGSAVPPHRAGHRLIATH